MKEHLIIYTDPFDNNRYTRSVMAESEDDAMRYVKDGEEYLGEFVCEIETNLI